MKAAFHYVVKARIIKFPTDADIVFDEFQEEFHDENPILARESVFNYYESILDILPEAKNNSNVTGKEARDAISEFLEPANNKYIEIDGRKIDFKEERGTGIGVFLVDDQALDKSFMKEFFIHGFGMSYEDKNPDFLMTNLEREVSLYDRNGYETKNYKRIFIYCNRADYEEGINDWDEVTILETPFDWTGYDEPWWGTHQEFIERSNSSEALTLSDEICKQLISTGETNQIEFKPALVYNFKTNKGGIGIKAIIAKAISAFLNSNGGFLLIGIGDDGTTLGLDHDFSLAEGKNPYDFFRLEFDNMIEHFLGFSVKCFINGYFITLENKNIYVVAVNPAKRPVFLNNQDNKEFYVRGEASCRQLTDIEEIINYCIDRFSNLPKVNLISNLFNSKE